MHMRARARLSREAVVQELQRDLALELQVLRAVDLGHPAGPDVLEHLVAPVDDGVGGDARHLRSSCMTCLAIGAATTPPWLWGPWTRSTVTATATFGCSRGAKPTSAFAPPASA